MDETNYEVDIVAMFPKLGPVVSIDGVAAGGKTTVARRVARRLGFELYDTGSEFRLAALLAAETAGWDADISTLETAAVEVARHAVVIFHDAPVGSNFLQLVEVAGRDVTGALRELRTSTLASQLAKLMPVRHALKLRQRRIGAVGKKFIVGRDIGTVIFPDADVKFLFEATSEARARRRLKEMGDEGRAERLAEIQKEIEERDLADSRREIAPLLLDPPSDTIPIPTHFWEGDIDFISKLIEYFVVRRLRIKI